jgi:glucose-6-phosphate isomerase
LDKHFVETNPRHNLPVLLALTDVWNDAFLGSSGRVLTPFSEAFSAFPSFVATLEAQTCGNRGTMDRSGRRAGIGKRGDGHDSCAAMVIDGGLRGDHDRALYQCGRPVASELITSMDTQAAARTSKIMGLDGVEEAFSNQDALLCSFFAHADVLAFGSEDRPGGSVSSPRTLFPSESFGSVVSNSVLPYSSRALAQSESFGSVASNSVLPVPYSSGEGEDIAEGNRPSTLLVCGICDAFTCGQLIALSEHRAAITARIWDVDPFAKGVGSSLRLERTEQLKNKLQQIYERMSISSSNHSDQAEDSTVNLATATILGHYATMMHDRKMYVVRGNS